MRQMVEEVADSAGLVDDARMAAKSQTAAVESP